MTSEEGSKSKDSSVAEQEDASNDGPGGGENVALVDGVWTHTDAETGVVSTYDAATCEWKPRAAHTQCVDGTWVHRDGATGVVSFYDDVAKQWVGAVDETADGEDDDDDDDGAEADKETTVGLAAAADQSTAEPPQTDDFEFQLQQERVERKRQRGALRAGQFLSPKDGVLYEWAAGAWSPVVNEDFIAKYQASYGAYEPPPAATAAAPPPIDPAIVEERAKLAAMTNEERKQYLKDQKREKRKAAQMNQRSAGWFEVDEGHNTSAYVTGLPKDITQDEFEEVMGKCGVIAKDPLAKKLKAKLYREQEDDRIKGDGLCSYVKPESVAIAAKIVDGLVLRGCELKVESAKFEMKGAYDTSKKKRRLTAKQKKRFKESQERLFDWRPEMQRGERPKSDCTVILCNVFTLKEMEDDASRIITYRDELTAECAKHGQVRKVQVYDRHPEGVVSVTMVTPEEADDCVTMMNYRVFKERPLRAALWDGKTKYRIEETLEEREKRLGNWDAYLAQD